MNWISFCIFYQGTTCKPSMGYSFGAGTVDGPGGFDFKQGKVHYTWYCLILHYKGSCEEENTYPL